MSAKIGITQHQTTVTLKNKSIIHVLSFESTYFSVLVCEYIYVHVSRLVNECAKIRKYPWYRIKR